MSEIKAGVKAELRRAVKDLKAIRDRLQATASRLEVSPDEESLEDDEVHPVQRVRSAIDCVLTDRLGPALKDLSDVARSRTLDSARRH